jgi:hypothetical protein
LRGDDDRRGVQVPVSIPAVTSNARSVLAAVAAGFLLSVAVDATARAGGALAAPVDVLTTETAAALFALVVAAPVALGHGVAAGYALAFGAGVGFSLSTGYPYAFSTPSLAELAPVAVVVGVAFAAVFGTVGTALATCWQWLRAPGR